MSEGTHQEGVVQEILSQGDLDAGEIRKELREKDVCFVKSYDRACSVLYMQEVPAIDFMTGLRRYRRGGAS